MPAAATSAQFLDLVRKSQLVDSARLEASLPSNGTHGFEEPRKAAEELVRVGLLTPYQAGMLLNGKWKGFFIAAGKYKLLQLLGVGGMGKVYLCEHTRMRRLVALKVLTLDPKKDASAVERFSREAVASGALKSPHIVRAHDIDQDGPLHFLVMEYVDGSSLQDIVKKHGPLEINRACHYISQAALGLQHAHEAGWVHRDIKPSNLLLDRTGTVKLLDMGLARFFFEPGKGITEQIDNNAVIGTADYLAPEQAVNSHDVDIRADIYSLGATFYYLLTGHVPFEQGTTAEKLLAHQMKEPIPATQWRPEIPAALDAIIKKMMAKKTVHRYQTPIAIVDALAPWTDTPIEKPAEEEMPRICTALESYIANGGSGPPSSINVPSSKRVAATAAPANSSSFLLRKGAPNATYWLGKAKQNPGYLAAIIGALVAAVGLTIYFWPSSKSADSKDRPVEFAQDTPGKTVGQNKPQPDNPIQPKPKPGEPKVNNAALAPIDAAKKIGEKVLVEFAVKHTGEARDKSRIFLNSLGVGDKDNFTVVLDMRKLANDLKAAHIDDAKRHYQGKIIRVVGTVSLYRESPQLVVENLSQIEVVQ